MPSTKDDNNYLELNNHQMNRQMSTGSGGGGGSVGGGGSSEYQPFFTGNLLNKKIKLQLLKFN